MTYVMTGSAISQAITLLPPPRHNMRQDGHEWGLSCLCSSIAAAVEVSLSDTVKAMEETCGNCNPLSMLKCIESCNIWRLKNQFRSIHKKMQEHDFMPRLLNALKNRKGLQGLQIISKNQVTISKLQRELKKLDSYHSQETIAEEYIQPLIDVGLVGEDRGEYFAAVLGQRINELTKRSRSIAECLPPHSEYFEKMVLIALLKEPKTYQALEALIPEGRVARALSRLQSMGLIEAAEKNDRVFFFTTQRNPDKESPSPTERRVHENLPEEGISARRLALRTNIRSGEPTSI
jgi:hypothetical protein